MSVPPDPARPYVDRGMGWIKLIAGIAGVALAAYFLWGQSQRRWGFHEPKDFIFNSALLGLFAWLTCAGAVQTRGRKLGYPFGLLILLVIAGTTDWTIPRILKAQRIKEEAWAWAQLQASPKTFADYQTYGRWTHIPRKGYASGRAMARTREELARLEQVKSGRVADLRRLISEHQSAMWESKEPEIQAAIDPVREALGKVYAKALADLGERLELDTAKREFPEDPTMRSAFAAILSRLARSDDDHVYLVFSSEDQMAVAPEEDSRATKERVIEPGDAFSPDREKQRRRAFTSAMEESLSAAFSEPLVRIMELSPGEGRDAKMIFQVHCKTTRAPGEFTLTRGGAEAGKLFNIDVAWDFSVIDADGKVLVRNQSHSNPAESVHFSTKKSDPDWAAYSVMMDSAYYNYCREVTGRLGLIPAAKKSYFSFEK